MSQEIKQITDRGPRHSLYEVSQTGRTPGGSKEIIEDFEQRLMPYAMKIAKLDFIVFWSSDLLLASPRFFETEFNEVLKKVGAAFRLKLLFAGGDPDSSREENRLCREILRRFPNWTGDLYVSHYVLRRGCIFEVTGVG